MHDVSIPMISPTLIGKVALRRVTEENRCLDLTAAAPHTSELLSAKRFKFCAASHAKIAKQVNRPAVDHLPQFEKGLVGRQIGIDDISFDLSGAFEDLWRGKDAHPAQLCVELDQRGNVRLSVLERMDIAF